MGIAKIIKNPMCIFSVLAMRGFFHWLPDRQYLVILQRATTGKWPDIKNPKNFNEKLQWLKLNDRRAEYTIMADKYRMRDYIAGVLGEDYAVPLLGVWEDPEQIDFDALPNQFAIKCNHNSGLGMYICHDKTQMDAARVKKALYRGLKQNYYLMGREWPYKNIPRRIICEEYLSDSVDGLTDYKVHCFGGEPKMVLVCKDRFKESGMTEDFFTDTWEHMDMKRPNTPNAAEEPHRPMQLEKMLEIARKLSAGIPFLRVDFYVVDGRIYIGELTFFPASGLTAFVPETWDGQLGQWIQLDQ